MELGIYHIAATLHMTVADLVERLSWREYLGWVAYFRHMAGESAGAGAGGRPRLLDGPNLLEDENALLAALSGGGR